MASSPEKKVPDVMPNESAVMDYLMQKIKGPSMFRQFSRLDDILTIDPWDAAAVDNRSPGEKYIVTRCTRTSDCRITRSGFWTLNENLERQRIGRFELVKRTFAFYQGRRPDAKLTEWRICTYMVDVNKDSTLGICTLYCDPAFQQYATDTASSEETDKREEFKARGNPTQRYSRTHHY